MSMVPYNIIKDYEWIIFNIVSRYKGLYSFDDLYQAGSIGLIKAYKKYNSNMNTKFSSFAYKYVFGEVIDYIKSDRNINVSEEYISLYKKYLSVIELLSNKYNREVSFSEVCSFMNIDEKYMLSIIEVVSFTISSNELLYEESNDDRDNIINNIILSSELDLLSEDDRNIIEYRYFKDYTQSETAYELGISQVMVSRREKLILQRIKCNLSE